jgi:hypothetical protein
MELIGCVGVQADKRNPEGSDGPQDKKVVGANGFEPSTSWVPTQEICKVYVL